MAGSPAETCQQLYVNDELLAVNHQDVSQMDHSDIVSLIKNSGVSIHLTVQQPEPEGETGAGVNDREHHRLSHIGLGCPSQANIHMSALYRDMHSKP